MQLLPLPHQRSRAKQVRPPNPWRRDALITLSMLLSPALMGLVWLIHHAKRETLTVAIVLIAMGLGVSQNRRN